MPLSPDDPRVIRVARALIEGCDGRECASEDAQRLHERYGVLRAASPSLSFSRCREMACCEFIAEVLG